MQKQKKRIVVVRSLVRKQGDADERVQVLVIQDESVPETLCRAWRLKLKIMT